MNTLQESIINKLNIWIEKQGDLKAKISAIFEDGLDDYYNDEYEDYQELYGSIKPSELCLGI